MKKDARWTLRLTPELQERIKKLAVQEERSLNGQIVVMLQREVERREKDGGLSVQEVGAWKLAEFQRSMPHRPTDATPTRVEERMRKEG